MLGLRFWGLGFRRILMKEVKSYQDLTVWQKAMDLVILCATKLVQKFPKLKFMD